MLSVAIKAWRIHSTVSTNRMAHRSRINVSRIRLFFALWSFLSVNRMIINSCIRERGTVLWIGETLFVMYLCESSRYAGCSARSAAGNIQQTRQEVPLYIYTYIRTIFSGIYLLWRRERHVGIKSNAIFDSVNCERVASNTVVYSEILIFHGSPLKDPRRIVAMKLASAINNSTLR